MKYIFGRSFGEFLVPDKNNTLRFIWSLFVVIVTDKDQFRVLGVDIEGSDTTVARPALVLKYSVLSQ